jgi:putative DNA primase/helicase
MADGHCGAGGGNNPLLTLALSASFAGPMLDKCNAEGGGVHFVGDSSTGKTTLLEAGCSIWGGAKLPAKLAGNGERHGRRGGAVQ